MESRSTALIVNWNGERFLDGLLNSLLKEKISEILVIDNNSTDASISTIERYPQIRLIRNDRNLGFGAAANQGFQEVKTPYALLLNVDTSVLSGCVRILEDALNNDPRVAAVAPRLVFPDGTLQESIRSFPTISRLFLYLSYLDRMIPSDYRLKPETTEGYLDVDQPMGAAILFRMSALQAVGVFDTQFQLYMEDVDLCERIRGAGFRILYAPAATVIHFSGGSSRQNWSRSQSEYFQSVIRYFKKKKGRMLLLRFSLSVALLMRAMAVLFAGRFRQAVFHLGMAAKIYWLT